MRYGIVSDIHGNIEALDAVIEDLHAQGAEAFLCLGDIVGYGADPNACCERVRALPGLLAVVGNHDAAAIGAFDLSWFHPAARESAGWTARRLSPDNRAFLRSLPETIRGAGFELVHGSLAEPVSGYLMDAHDARAHFELQREPVCFVGHTHIPAAFARRRGRLLAASVSFAAAFPLEPAPESDYVLNCGSVGQPRDGNPAAACGLYDTQAGTVQRIRVPYPAAAAAGKIRAAGLPAGLASRLELGE